MKRTTLYISVISILVVLAAAGAWCLTNTPPPHTGTPEPIIIGLPSPAESSALVYIADDQNLFSRNGINATIVEYDTGIHAVNEMLADNKPDIAVAAEYIIVGKVFEREKVKATGTIARQQIFDLVARKDQGILNPQDLKGKKIGVAPGTISGFYLGRYLELHNVDLNDVTIVDIAPAQFADAIENGSVDAVSVWGTYTGDIRGRLGDNAIVWPEQSGQLVYWTAICRDDWAAQHPELIERFLKSLDEAANYAVSHPAEAKAILKARLHADDTYIDSIWSNSDYSLSLDQSLITAMEDEGRWMIRNNLTDSKAIQDYGEYIYSDGLEKLKPEAVNIIEEQ